MMSFKEIFLLINALDKRKEKEKMIVFIGWKLPGWCGRFKILGWDDNILEWVKFQCIQRGTHNLNRILHRWQSFCSHHTNFMAIYEKY